MPDALKTFKISERYDHGDMPNLDATARTALEQQFAIFTDHLGDVKSSYWRLEYEPFDPADFAEDDDDCGESDGGYDY